MSSLTVTPLSTALGAQISGVDITQPLNPEQRDAIEQALLTHSVVFFRDQPLTPQQQARFAANFGDLHIHPILTHYPQAFSVVLLLFSIARLFVHGAIARVISDTLLALAIALPLTLIGALASGIADGSALAGSRSKYRPWMPFTSTMTPPWSSRIQAASATS